MLIGIGITLHFAGTAQAQTPPATVKITAPADGATIDGPVMVGVEVNGATVKHWNEQDPTAVHHHLLVDVDPSTVVQAGVPLPPGQSSIIHTIDLNRELMDLAPGPHTVTVVLTGTDHVPFSPSIQDQVSFTVRGAAGALPRTGTGGGLLGDTTLPVQIALAVVAAIVAGMGGLLIRTRIR
ncbi:MAG: DUF4399 domain-containing protein, partial [Dehalococcoidia bacterium]